MPKKRVVNIAEEERKRSLRAEAARGRTRLLLDASGMARETRVLMSWKTYVRRHPLVAVTSAAALGLLTSTVFRRGGWKGWVRQSLMKQAMGLVAATAWSELATIWQSSRPDSPTYQDE